MKDLKDIEKEVIELAKSHIIDNSLNIDSLKESVVSYFTDNEQEAAMCIVISLEEVLETKASRDIVDSVVAASDKAIDGANGIVEYLKDFSSELRSLTARNKAMTMRLRTDRLNSEK